MGFWKTWLALTLLETALWAGLPWLPASQTRPAVEKPPALPASLATWNLQWFPGNRPQPSGAERENHRREVARVLSQLEADIVLVQEVADRKALADVAEAYPWRVVSDFQRAGDEDPDLPAQNVAILSKVPIREAWEVGFHELPLTPDRPVRGFLGVRLGSRKKGVTVYTLHLKSNRGGREAAGRRRERAMGYLQDDWQKRGLDPSRDAIIVAGDFNCSLRNPEFAEETTIRGLLQERWVSATEKIAWPQAATVRPDPQGKYQAADFDHILLSPGWEKRRARGARPSVELNPPGEGGPADFPFQAGILQDPKVPSDHWPVWVRWKNGESAGNLRK